MSQPSEATMSIESVFRLPEIEFLKALMRRYPEARLVAGPAMASPEGPRLLSAKSLARQVFDLGELDPHAIEADRTLMGLLLLRDCLLGLPRRFPKLDSASFHELRSHALSILDSPHDLEGCAYALACNDLGKTLSMQALHARLRPGVELDHDQMLAELRTLSPGSFPGMARLEPARAEMLRLADQADFNLGHFVQGETPLASLSAIVRIPKAARDIRIIAEIFDFAGAAGHLDSEESLLLGEENMRAYARAIGALEADDLAAAWTSFHLWRAKGCGVLEGGAALGRLCSLTRSFSPADGDRARSAWSALPERDRATLEHELTRGGQGADSAILPYYAPAFLAKAVAAGRLGPALSRLAALMRGTRAEMQSRGAQGLTMLDLSKEALAFEPQAA